MSELKILIVDDEKPARIKIQTILLSEFNNLIIDFAENGKDAVNKIFEFNPDLVFLDIQMPGLNGFEVISEIGIEKMPSTIFVTAYDQFAIEAFEVQAIDYLLKPFDKDRLIKAFNNAQTRASKNEQKKIINLFELIDSQKKFKTRLMIKDGSIHYFINTDEIIFLEVNDKYLDIKTSTKKYLHRDTITSMEQQLDPNNFKRVNRSAIINLNFIKEIQPWSHGDYIIILSDGNKIKLSRKYSPNILSN